MGFGGLSWGEGQEEGFVGLGGLGGGFGCCGLWTVTEFCVTVDGAGLDAVPSRQGDQDLPS